MSNHARRVRHLGIPPVLAAWFAIGCLFATPAAADDPPPNFVVILVDDLGWTDLGCMGSRFYETPHVDRLAAGGMTLSNGYAACAVCSPTRAAVQTGRYPARVGVTDWIRAKFQGGAIGPDGNNPAGYTEGSKTRLACPQNPLFMELDELTLAEALKPAGYVSCHIGKWHLGQKDQFPERQGYAENLGGCDLGQPPSYFDPYASNRESYEIPNLPPRQQGEYLTDREADEAVGFIRRNRDKPFFLHLAHYCVHTPLMGKKDVIAKYADKPTTNQKNATYAAMVESVDDACGRVVEVLDELGLSGRTLIVFTSDNGGLLGPTDNKPLRSGKGFPYEGGIRVPWIVCWPGAIEAGSKSDVPISSVDLFPTLLELAGVPLPEGRAIDGVSLVPLLKQSGGIASRDLLWHFPHYRFARGPYSILRSGDFKLIKWYAEDGYELFNLADDLGETTDLAAAMPEKVRELDARLAAMLKECGAKLPRATAEFEAKP